MNLDSPETTAYEPGSASGDIDIVKHLDWHTIITVDSETPPEMIAALDAYFTPFAQVPIKDDGKLAELPCLKCGELLNGDFVGFLMDNGGGFEWGLTHGEGHCKKCGWPARAYHFIKDKDGKELGSIRGLILQYHPDFVERRARSAR